jgi:hypothetical protein
VSKPKTRRLVILGAAAAALALSGALAATMSEARAAEAREESAGAELEEFRPSSRISADREVSFPVDI